MGFDFILDELHQTVDDIPDGASFFAKDLLKGAEWKELPVGDRIRFGKYFKRKVENEEFPDVRYQGKANNNSAIYKKKKSKELMKNDDQV